MCCLPPIVHLSRSSQNLALFFVSLVRWFNLLQFNFHFSKNGSRINLYFLDLTDILCALRQEELDTILLKKDEDLKNLKLLMAQKEIDLQELKTQRTLSSVQLDLAMKELEELNKNILMSQRK